MNRLFISLSIKVKIRITNFPKNIYIYILLKFNVVKRERMTLKNIEKLKPLDMTILLLYLFNFEKLKPLDMMIVFFFFKYCLNLKGVLKYDIYFENRYIFGIKIL